MRHLSDANAQDGNFGTQIRSAIFWRSGSQIVSQVVSWTSTLIVVRLLDPADYGLFAMTLVVLNFMGFMNGYGLVSALVQAPVLNIQQIRQAFGLMLVLNGGLALAQLFLRWDEKTSEHTSELQSLMRISYAVFCLKKKTK